jgi:electron transport complex protein RnfG
MAKRESTFINMVSTLLAVTLIAAATLGFVYDLTKDAIELAKQKAQDEAIAKVLPAYEKLGESLKWPQTNPAPTAWNSSRPTTGPNWWDMP